MKWQRIFALALTLTPMACSGKLITLSMTPLSPAYVDQSSVSPSLQSGIFERIMIVPPPGSAGVEFQDNLAAIERSFIARGITVISSAITSRVISTYGRDTSGLVSSSQSPPGRYGPISISAVTYWLDTSPAIATAPDDGGP